MSTKSEKTSNSSAKGGEPVTMEELLARAGTKIQSFTSGQHIKATLLSKDTKTAVFDIGGKSEGILIGSNFDEVKDYVKDLEVGKSVNAVVIDPEANDGMVRLSLRHTAHDSVWKRLDDAYDKDEIIQVTVRGIGDKGITVDIDSTLTGFIPASHVGKEAAENSNSLVGNHIEVKVVELDRDRNRVVLSERAVSEAEDIQLQELAMGELTEGDKYSAKVVQLTNFGIFVEITVEADGKKVPIEGLVHVSEMAWEKVDKPSDMVAVGDKVEVRVLDITEGKLSLSMKQAKADPWDKAEEKYTPDTKVSGTVVRVSDFGVFVELEPGVEGLVHVTKIPPGTNLPKGQDVECYVEEVDTKERRISLGLVLTSKPVGYK